MLKSNSTLTQLHLNRTAEEKQATLESHIAYNQKIASMSKREYLEDKIARCEGKLATGVNSVLAQALQINIEVSRKELANLK